jgi:PAS domain S-box-containing protein
MAPLKVDVDPYVEFWQSLGQVVPRVESADTLGTTVATALHQAIGAGKAAIILRRKPLLAEPGAENHSKVFFLRLVGGKGGSRNPIYLEGNRGILARLDKLSEPLLLTAPWPAEHNVQEDPLLQLASHSLLIQPIPNSPDGTPWGAVCLLDVPQEALPGDGFLAGVSSFTSLSLGLLANKAQGARQEVEYGIVSDVGQSLTSTLSLDEIFEKILSSVRTTIDASEVSVGLIDEEAQEIILEKSLMGPEFNELPPVRLKLGQGIAGWVGQTGQPLNVPDVTRDPRWFSGVDQTSGFVTKSILCVPLVVKDQVIGIMEAVNKRSGHFSDADERLLTALSSFVAIAIEKARLHLDVLAEKRRMEALFANMSEGLLTMNLAGRITAVNPALQAIVGRPEPEMIGEYCCGAIRTDPDALTSVMEHLQSSRREQATFHTACDIVRPDEKRVPVLVSAAPTFEESGEVSEVVIVFSDVTQILELERMKEDFIANVTHELRTPLATILLYARLLRAGKARHDPTREARYLKVVEEQSNHLQQLVRQILDLSRMRTTFAFADQEPVEIGALVNELLSSLERLAQEKGLTLRASVADDLPTLMTSREAVRLILKNLIDNAIKFTPRGEIVVTARRKDARIQIEIRDEGIGIAPESMPHLFQRFYRAQAAVERGIGGSGLGLALVREAVEKIGGEISVQSQVNKGSTFSVVLPVTGSAGS